MADKIAMISKQIHKFAGKICRKGDRILVTEREFKWLRALGRAVPEIEHSPAPAPVEPPAVEVVTRPKRAYKRKDIAPTETAVLSVQPPAEPDEPQYGARFAWPTGSAATDDDEPSA